MAESGGLPEEVESEEPDARIMAEVLKEIPGADERITAAREEIARGDSTPLDDL